MAGQTLISFTPAGPDGYWATTNGHVFRFGVNEPLALTCAGDGSELAAIAGTPERVWLRNDYMLGVCKDGVISTVEWTTRFAAKYSICDDGSYWVNDRDVTLHGGRPRSNGDWVWGGVCAGNAFFALKAYSLVKWTDDDWVEHGPSLEMAGPTAHALGATLTGTAPDDLWLHHALWGRLHWDGRRWTRVDEDVRAWLSPRPGEAWVLGHDGALSHRRRP